MILRKVISGIEKSYKFIQGLEQVPYSMSLNRIKLFSFSKRRLRGDLICVRTFMRRQYQIEKNS